MVRSLGQLFGERQGQAELADAQQSQWQGHRARAWGEWKLLYPLPSSHGETTPMEHERNANGHSHSFPLTGIVCAHSTPMALSAPACAHTVKRESYSSDLGAPYMQKGACRGRLWLLLYMCAGEGRGPRCACQSPLLYQGQTSEQLRRGQ